MIPRGRFPFFLNFSPPGSVLSIGYVNFKFLDSPTSSIAQRCWEKNGQDCVFLTMLP